MYYSDNAGQNQGTWNWQIVAKLPLQSAPTAPQGLAGLTGVTMGSNRQAYAVAYCSPCTNR